MRIQNPDLETTKQRWKPVHFKQIYTEITHDFAQGIFW